MVDSNGKSSNNNDWHMERDLEIDTAPDEHDYNVTMHLRIDDKESLTVQLAITDVSIGINLNSLEPQTLERIADFLNEYAQLVRHIKEVREGR